MVSLARHAACGDEMTFVKTHLETLALPSYVSIEYVQLALIAGLVEAIDATIGDHLVTEDQFEAFNNYISKFSLDPQDIEDFRAPTGATLTECEDILRNTQVFHADFAEEGFSLQEIEAYRKSLGMPRSGYTRMTYSNALRELQEGKFIGFDQEEMVRITEALGHVPFNFQRSETLYWLFRDVPYYQEKVITERRGGYGGVSFRVLNGVYYSTGSFHSRSFEESSNEHVDTGLLGITDKHLYFAR